MAILRERTGWKRPKAPGGPDLTPDEQQAVGVALALLTKRRGTWAALADAMAAG